MHLQPNKTKLVILYCAVAVLGIGDLLLIFQNRQLKDQVHNLVTMWDPLQEGMTVSGFHAQTLTGEQTDFALDRERNYLLFVFSTTCAHCEANLPNWNRLAEEAKAANIDVVGISLHDPVATMEYVSTKGFEFPAIVATDSSFKNDFRVYMVPNTILLAGDGEVRKAWAGALEPDEMGELRAMLSEMN